MSHSHHGGHSDAMAGPLGKDFAKQNAFNYWYIVAGVVGAQGLARAANYYIARRRLRSALDPTNLHPTRPANRYENAWATATAVVRELNNPQLYIPVSWLSWASPPPLGRVIILVAYWAMLIYMVAANDVGRKDVFYWERIGFRNAWTTIMQMPLIYILASKANVIGFITGTSHERLNWLHRWIARTMFITATLHGGFFWTQWVRADFVEYQFKIMPSMKYGVGAWFVLLWIFVTSFYPVRRLAYEVFVIQHIASVVLFIWLVWTHVLNADARWFIWLSIAAIVFDRFVRLVNILWQNVKFTPKSKRSACRGNKSVGHQTIITAVGESTLVTLKDVHFRWRAGQHVYLWLPRIGPLETHPYTISCTHRVSGECICNSIQLMIRAQGGFSKRLHKFAKRLGAQGRDREPTLTAFMAGPFGAPPRVDIYETVILISASTGASFTLPLMDRIVSMKKSPVTCTKRVEFILLTRQGEEIDLYWQRICDATKLYRERGIKLRVHLAITNGKGASYSEKDFNFDSEDNDLEKMPEARPLSPRLPSSPFSIPSKEPAVTCCETEAVSSSCCQPESSTAAASNCCDIQPCGPSEECETEKKNCCDSGHAIPESNSQGPGADALVQYDCRPDLEALIREPVEAAFGETSVVVCGGLSLTTSVRNIVTKLSDERAVHKGTGAQGIYLYVEEYSI